MCNVATMPQRSPVIFWLLVAATLSVDAVALVWARSQPSALISYAEVAYDALILAQLSLVCIWSALNVPKSFWTQAAPWVAVAVASLSLWPLDESPLTVGLPYYGFYAACLVTALWLFARTAFWRRRTPEPAPWQFSVAHLLFAMTIVAVLAAAMRSSYFWTASVWENVAFIGSSVAFSMACVTLWCLSIHWLLRLASALALAIGFATVWSLGGLLLLSEFSTFLLIFAGFYLIQAVVLSTWLGLGPILPLSSATAASDG